MAAIASSALATQRAVAAEFLSYFLPTPIYDKLESGVWGAAGVVPREQHNGLEDFTMANFAYWDGKIIKGPDGKYHLFGSRWAQSGGHAGYPNSVCIHAVSDSVTGPYADKGLCYPTNQGGKGHNVTAIAMHDGRYAILVSDTRPGDLFIASSLDGPWVYQGRVQIDTNGFTTTRLTDNMSIMLRPDGRYMIVPLGGFVMISDSGIMGPYKVVTNNIFPQNVTGYRSATREDPVVWYSGCQYHVVVDDYADRKGMHLTSPDGITWTYKDLAYDPTSDFVRYTDGSVNHWYKLERMGVLLEGEHVTHFTFAAIDVDKTLDLGNDQHGSKIIVVPFDGARFDAETGRPGCASTGTGGAAGAGGSTSTSGGKASFGGTTSGGATSGGTTSGGTTSGGTTSGGASLGGSSVSGGSSGSGGARGGAAGSVNGSGGSLMGQSGAGSGGSLSSGGVASAGQGSAAETGGAAFGGTGFGGSGATLGGSFVNGGATFGSGGASASGTAGSDGRNQSSGCTCKQASVGSNSSAPGLAVLALAAIGRRARRRRHVPMGRSR
ncbi:MAG: glycoside hydrolase family protein [Polyangiaceae bacterium]